MYFTSLPDHTAPGFDETAHFSQFKKHNIVFNAESSNSYCDDHAGCLSIKTILQGEEWYGIDHRRLAVRPGQYLVLNDDQHYSCRIHEGEKVKCLSVFFQKDFAAAVFHDLLYSTEQQLDQPHTNNGILPEFFQTLNPLTSSLQSHLHQLVATLEKQNNNEFPTDELLIFLLGHLITAHRTDLKKKASINAIKASTRHELYKRVCMARDLLHSSYYEQLDLHKIGACSHLSVPQLVKQFRAAFGCTPHQYLIRIRLEHAASLLKQSSLPVQDISMDTGFESVSAFCRAFKSAYGLQPLLYRITSS
ncbi:AraC-like DNA-binding protein [Pseudobacter ginsenosidimutans]|uniref:AraC-like DNA-binding protein n=2 Tax=Pseudobacter ginsenosidimutans TaxID=661488 RepID=A0A4Q7N2Q2_9BACT|nr:AraC-like DNA-binding protein [Pseudobacter ginsenosidimutans]